MYAKKILQAVFLFFIDLFHVKAAVLAWQDYEAFSKCILGKMDFLMFN